MSVQALNRKEAIASGEDIAPVTREEYYLKGLAEGQGGGGLDYVIPEQTVTFEIHGEEATPYAILTGVDFSKLELDQTAPVKIITSPENPTMYVAGTLMAANSFKLDAGGNIVYEDSIYKWKNPGAEGQTVTITAITGF